MIRRKYVRSRQLQPGMKLDHPVVDRLGRVLVARGAELDQYMIDSMIKIGIMDVYIQEGEDDDEELVISPIAEKNIERLKKEDRAKVSLSDSVRKRVAEGIQTVYNNVDSGELAGASEMIATDLMNAIQQNDAMALDISALKTSDEYTFKHSVDVATIAMIVAKRMGFSTHEIHEIGMAGLLHDVGKMKVPTEILNKPARLSDEEFEVMKQHSVLGYRIVQNHTEISENIKYGVLQHHEKINGKGYPIGLSGEKINPYAKVIAVADIYDALVTERPYKKSMTQRDAVEMIMAMTDEIEINAMKSFLNSVILYPVGSTVQLSNGETAKVVENNMQYILRPKVVGLKTGKVYDLAEDLKCASIIIL